MQQALPEYSKRADDFLRVPRLSGQNPCELHVELEGVEFGRLRRRGSSHGHSVLCIASPAVLHFGEKYVLSALVIMPVRSAGG